MYDIYELLCNQISNRVQIEGNVKESEEEKSSNESKGRNEIRVSEKTDGRLLGIILNGSYTLLIEENENKAAKK